MIHDLNCDLVPTFEMSTAKLEMASGMNNLSVQLSHILGFIILLVC